MHSSVLETRQITSVVLHAERMELSSSLQILFAHLHMRAAHVFTLWGGNKRLKFNILSHWKRKCAAALIYQLGSGLGSL